MKKTIALILLLLGTVGFSACGKQVSPIQLPAAESLVSVHISSDGTTKTYTDTAWMQELLSTLSAAQPTSQESVQDYPDAASLVSVHISSDGTTKTYTDTAWMQELLSTLSAAQPTSQESVQDYPDAAHPIQIIFDHQGGGTSIVFAYEKNGAYYLEQPYQGIYQLTAEQYNWLVQTE